MKKAEAVKARRTESHQDSRNYPLHLIFALIKFQKTGIKSRLDLEEQMAYLMVIHGHCCGEQIEEISVLLEILNAEVEFTLPKYLKWN